MIDVSVGPRPADGKRFGTVDLHALAKESGVDLEPALERLRALYAETDARNAKNTEGMDLPCHQGCSSCCEEMVFLTPLEFLGAWDHLQSNYSADVVDETVRQGLAIYDHYREAFEAFGEAPPEGQKDHTAIAITVAFRCPLLSDEGTCRIYPMREILGRLFGCSFNDNRGIYGCGLSGDFFAGKTVTLARARDTAMQVHALPMTTTQSAYPAFIHALYRGGPSAPSSLRPFREDGMPSTR